MIEGGKKVRNDTDIELFTVLEHEKLPQEKILPISQNRMKKYS